MNVIDYTVLLLASVLVPGIVLKLQSVYSRAFVSKEILHLGGFFFASTLFGVATADATLKSVSLTILSWVAYGEWYAFFHGQE